ncbi:MAG: hypothetical protein IPH53_13295 [Flavobacteriales bacterium]|nr:hypothetical protein [Flavobacteriales bacterium]
MLLIALLLVPFLAAALLLVARPDGAARTIALLSSFITAALAILLWVRYPGSNVTLLDLAWMPDWGLRFTVGYDGTGLLFLLLTALIFPFIIGAGRRKAPIVRL